MSSEVEVCNVALGRLGIDQFIENLDEANTRARTCKNFYAPTRDLVLEDFPWDFAQKCIALAEVAGDPPPGWAVQYSVPSDCLRAQAIVQNSNLPAGEWNFGPYWHYDRLPYRVPWRIIASATPPQRLIITHLEEAYLWYTAKITDVNQFSALFRSQLAWRLAADMALTLKANVDLALNAGKMYVAEGSRAATLSISQRSDGDAPDSPSITARR